MDEIVVFLMREFGWSLEYVFELLYGVEGAKKRLKKPLSLKKLNALIQELKYQKAVEDYQIASNFAMALANWASTQSKSRHYKVSDFIGEPPTRGKKEGSGLLGAAEREGIILPRE